jgi:ATP-binding cassette subfamily B protein
MPLARTDVPVPPDTGISTGRWIEAVAAAVGLEADPAAVPYAAFNSRLAGMGPALIKSDEGHFIALLAGGRVLSADGKIERVAAERIQAEVCRDLEDTASEELQEFLDGAAIKGRRRSRVLRAIMNERLGSHRITGIWLLRLSPATPFRQQLAYAGVPRRLAWLVAAHASQYLLFILAWWTIGRAALNGQLDMGWLAAWALLLLTLVPLRVAITWLQGRIAIAAGGILKERLLFGSMRMQADEIRAEGAGQLLGRVIESEALESMALGGGFLAIVSLVELAIAALVLAAGAGGWPHALLLALWTGATVFVARRFYERARAWTDARRGMTHDLVERMVGHRTRVAQESRETWHDAEDAALDSYHSVCLSMDRFSIWLKALAPRGWFIIGVLGIAPAFVSGSGTPAQLAVAVGGILLAFRAFRRLSAGLWNVAGAAIAWNQVAPLFEAAERQEPAGSAAAAASASRCSAIEAHNVGFAYTGRGKAVLENCTLRVGEGDRVLLQGSSGGGKSTLASLLTGVRRPQTGLILAGGLDRQTLGAEGWLERIAAAPQFHENHVLTGPFAFNLLMGRRGLLGEKDIEEAEEICRELGLDALLERMPAGMSQVVGDTGWQLSHGERSRVYIARALLQGSGVVILDESFAALDPENLKRAMECVQRRARGLLVIAHP